MSSGTAKQQLCSQHYSNSCVHSTAAVAHAVAGESSPGGGTGDGLREFSGEEAGLSAGRREGGGVSAQSRKAREWIQKAEGALTALCSEGRVDTEARIRTARVRLG